MFHSYFPAVLRMDSTYTTVMLALGGDFGGYSEAHGDRQDPGCAKVVCGKLL